MTGRLRDLMDSATSTPLRDRQILWRIVIYAFVFKLLIAIILPLGVDEAYATAVARQFSLSFFDHPPVSFWLPVIFANLTGIEHKLIYRLPFLLAGLATTPVMYLIGQEAGGRRAGIWSALLYAVAPFFMISAGVLVVPDGTLNLGLAVAVLFLVKIAKRDDAAPLRYWVYTGLALAFALASKYQAAWLPVAVLLFMVVTIKGRRWFLQPGPWIGAAIGLLGLLPVVLWNMQHDWVSFTFQSSRAGDGTNLKNLVLMLFLQALFLLPATLVVAVAALRQNLRRGVASERFLLALIALGPILIFNYVFLTSARSLAHWPMPGWQFALPLAGIWLAGRTNRGLRRFYGWTLGSLVLIWVPVLALIIHADTGFLTRPFYDRAPKWDNTISLFDYGGLRAALETRGLWRTTDVFMASSWTYGGLLETALASRKPMRIVDRAGAHHFAYMRDAKASGAALFMAPATFQDQAKVSASSLAQAQKIDPGAKVLAPIILTRGGQPYVVVVLVRLMLK